MPRNVAIGIISLTRRSPRETARRLDFDPIEPSAAASVDTSRDGARAEERESTGSARTERTGSMQSADDAGEVGRMKRGERGRGAMLYLLLSSHFDQSL